MWNFSFHLLMVEIPPTSTLKCEYFIHWEKPCSYLGWKVEADRHNFCLKWPGDFWQIRVMVFNATFNNNSVISWQSVLLVEETGVPVENHRSAVIHWQTLSHNVASSTPCLSGILTHVSGDIHWIESCKSYYYTINTWFLKGYIHVCKKSYMDEICCRMATAHCRPWPCELRRKESNIIWQEGTFVLQKILG